MNHLITILLLKSNTGWVDTLFLSIRSNMTSISSTSVQVATELACIFIIINLVNIAKTIMSDNQMGGMGGIDVAQIIRPIVFLAMIESFSPILSAFDNTVQTVTDNLLDKSKNVTYDYGAGIADIGNDTSKPATYEFWKNPVDYLISKLLTLLGFGDMEIARMLDTSMNGSFLAMLAEAVAGFLAWIEKWCMRIMTHMYLGFLSITGPLVFAFSILDNWKDGWKSWLGTYIEVCFWGFGIEMVVLMGNVAHSAIAVEFAKKDPAFFDTVGKIKHLIEGKGAAWIHVAISICTIRLLKSVPSLVHMALSLGGSSTETSSAGGVATGVASKAANAAKTAAEAAL